MLKGKKLQKEVNKKVVKKYIANNYKGRTKA